MASNGRMIINYEGCEMKWLSPVLEYFPNIFLERLWSIISIMTTSLRVKDKTEGFQNMKKEY
jgi:hypothetical protein